VLLFSLPQALSQPHCCRLWALQQAVSKQVRSKCDYAWQLIDLFGSYDIGSVAATIHGSIGNVIAGSSMAIAQSAGAGGSGLVIVNGVAQLGGAAVTLGTAGFAWVKAKL
jgi:hypothetical protein